jgi:hypothetical protein
MRIRRVLAAVLAIALTGGVGACTSGRKGSAEPSAPAAPSAWDLTLRRIGPDGRVDLATALSAFALAIGPVPGGVPVSGPATAIPSGTIAVRWVLGHWSELSADQRKAVLAGLGTSTATTAPAGLVLRAPRAPSPDPSPNLACLPADSAGAEPYRAQLAGIESELTAHLGRPFPFPKTVFMSVNTRNLEGPSLMYTYPCGRTAKGTYTGCTVHINPRTVGGTFTDAEVHSFLVHELTHCYLDGRFGAAYGAMPQWYVEGAPTWTMAQLGTSSTRLGGIWKDYLDTQSWELYRRTYSGLGFFVHLAETGADVWKAIDTIGAAMQPLTANGPIAETRAGWAAAGATPAFLDSWGGGFVQGRYPGTAWTSTGPNLPRYQPALPTARLRNGDTLALTAKEFAATAEQLDVDAEVITVAPGAGTTGRMTLGTGRDAVLGTGGPYCTVAGCACPAGSPGEGTHFDAMAGGQQYLGLTGGAKAGTVTLIGQSLTDFCRKPSRSCLVGQWTTTNLEAHTAQMSEQGGAGVRLHIDPQGHLTLTFDGMAPVNFTFQTGSTHVAGNFTYSGTITETLVLPPASVASGDSLGVKNPNVSALTATVHVTSPFSTTVGPLNVSQLAGQLGGAGGAVSGNPIVSSSWRCTGDTLVTGTTSDTINGSWTLTRTGPE